MADSGGNKSPDRGRQSTSGKVDTKLKKAERAQQTQDVSSPDPVTGSSTADGPSGQGKDTPSKSTESARSLPKVPGKNTLPQKQESKPPDTESHSTSGEVDTKPKEEERTRPTPNVSSPDATVTGRSTSDGPSGQGKDEPFKSAESAAGSMQNVPGEKSPTKNKNKGRYIQDITTNYEEKHKAEQKWVHSGEKQTGESTKTEIKPVIPKANTPVLSLDGTQDMVEKLRSDKKLAKQNKNQQITGADDVQQIQTPHPGIRRKATKEGEDHTSEKLDGSFVIVNPIQSANDNRAEVNKEKEMPDKPAGASKISENLQKDKTAGLDEEEEIKEDIVEENPVRSKLPTAFQSGLMRKRQDHSQVTASAPKLGENNEREEYEKQTGDLDNEREHKKENVQSLDNASVLQNTEKDKEGTCAQQDDSTEISIDVKTLTGKVLTINIKQTDTIAKVREKIKDKEGTAVDDQRLVFEGKKLEVNQTLSEYNIGQGSIIHLVVRKTDDDVPKQFENNLSEVEEQIEDSMTKKQEQKYTAGPTPAPRKTRGTKDNQESVPEHLNSGQSEITSRQPRDEASSPQVPAQEKAIGESQHTDDVIPLESGSQLSGSSSFERLPDEEQGETSFHDENVSLQFQMRSMTQMADHDMKDLEGDKKTSPFKEPDMKTDIAVANGKVKDITNAGEDKETNNKESEDISPEYRLEQVGRTYILHSKIHKPVKVTELNGKLDVCMEGNYILIKDDPVYLISYECGKITTSKVEETKVEENQACSPSPITTDHHIGNKIPYESEVKPNKEEHLDSGVEEITDMIKHFGIEDNKDEQGSAPKDPNRGQSKIASRQAQTDLASSPTVPAREKAIDTSEDFEVKKPIVFGKHCTQELFKDKWKREFRNVMIQESSNGTETCIKLKGPKTEVEKARKYVYDYPCFEISFKDVTNRDKFKDVSPLLEEFFHDKYADDEDIFWDINKQTQKIGICSNSQEKTSDATQKVKKCIKIKNCINETSALKNEDQLVEVLNETISENDKHFVCICRCEGVIKICGLLNFIEKYQHKMKEAEADFLKSDFIKRQAVVQPFPYNMESNYISRTVNIQNPLVYKFISKRKPVKENENLKVICLENPLNQGIFLQGQSEKVVEAENALTALETDIEIWLLYVEFLTGGLEFGEIAHVIERQLCVTFEREDSDEAGNLLKENDDVCFVLPGGHQIQLMRTCRTEQKMSITFCERSREKDSGEAWFERSENSIHVFVPFWEDGLAQEKETVRRRFQSCLDKCLYRFKHIDLILSRMSWKSGKFVKQLLVQLKRVLNKDYPRISVCLCCTDYDTKEEVYIAVKDSLKRPDSVDEKPRGFVRSNAGLFLSVRKGSLADTKADILVNTITSNGDLNNGEVAKSLLEKAGNILQTEVSKKSPFECWNIGVTPAHISRCKYIFHVVLGAYDKEINPKKKLTQLVHDCLQKAADLEVKSIAFPALGAGGLQYPCEEVIDAMYQGVDVFELSQGNKKRLKEVKFVLFKEDVYKMYKYERDTRGFTAAEVSCRFVFGKISFHAEEGDLFHADKDCILYLWQQDVFRTAARGKHPLLKELDDSASSEWIRKRDKRETAFLTNAGKNFHCEKIVHVVYEKKATIEALKSGLKFASMQMVTSVAIALDTSITTVLTALSDIAPDIQNEMEIALFISNPHFTKVKSKLHENRQCASSGKQKAIYALSRVVGRREDVQNAIQKLKEVEDVSFTEVHFPQNEKMTVQTKPDLSHIRTIEPGDMNISRGVTAPKLGVEEDVLSWDKKLLEEVSDMSRYVEVQNIPDNMKQEQLHMLMFQSGFPVAPPVLVYNTGCKTALLICNTAEDASRLSVYTQSQFCFKRLNRKVMSSFTSNIDAEVWNAAKKRNKDREILDQFKNIHVTIDENRPFEMKAFTSYQIERAKAIEVNFAVELLGTDRNDSARNSFTVYEQEIIENISKNVWNTLEAWLCDDIAVFETDFGRIKFEQGTISFPPYEGEIPTALARKLRKRASELSERDILEIEIETDKQELIPQWCKEVEGVVGRPSCVWNKKKKVALAFGDTYEENLSIKHQLSLKSGKVKPRIRKPCTKTQDGDTGYSSMQYVPENPKQNQATQLQKNFIWTRDAKYRRTFKTPEGLLVYVYKANILNLPVDCIVNAANGNLSHGGGVAYVIAKAAGNELTRQGDEYIHKIGILPVGQTCTTTAGNLNYRCVIHTVGPAWSDYLPHAIQDVKKCETDLYNAIFNSFIEAERRKLKSIALPAVSSAIFGVPEEVCVHQYARATVDYSKKAVNSNDRLTEIHFIDIKENIVQKIQTAFKSFLEGGGIPIYDSNDFVQYHTRDRGGRHSTKTTQRWPSPKSTPSSPSLPEPLTYEDEWKNQVFLFTGFNTDRVLVCCGDIFRIKGSAIVVPRDRQGASGEIGKKIGERVPTGLRTVFASNLKKCFGYDIKVGDVILSDGYSCGFPNLLNVIHPRDTRKRPNEDRKKDLMNAYNNILQKADAEAKINTVVMTYFGIDPTNDEDLRICADAFLQSYLGFCKRKLLHAERSHLEVKFVCRTEYAFDIVCGLLNKYVFACKKEIEENKHEIGHAGQVTALLEDADKEFNADSETEKCVICIDNIDDPKTLPCGHTFCTSCIDQHFTFQKKCPTCGSVCGKITGDQPEGKMTIYRDQYKSLSGYETVGTIMITYTFQSGRQEKFHPKPGKFYKGITRVAYLPDNEEGNKVVKMLDIAFNRRLVFTIGSSRTTGHDGVITWNDIHHKTDPRPNTQFGYPDGTYLSRVKEELAAKGITEEDIPSN